MGSNSGWTTDQGRKITVKIMPAVLKILSQFRRLHHWASLVVGDVAEPAHCSKRVGDERHNLPLGERNTVIGLL